MKILWLCNMPLPGACKAFNLQLGVGGGWLNEELIELAKNKDLNICVCFTDRNSHSLKKAVVDGITYYSIPRKIHSLFSYDKSVNRFFEQIVKAECPQIVHIHGTENANAWSLMKACPSLIYVISLQGIITYIQEHERAGIPYFYRKNTTLFSFLSRNGVDSIANKHKKYSLLEKQVIAKSDYILGRTTWDFACSWQLNPKAKYIYNPRLLRHSFYENEWNINECKRYTIFLSQAGAALKGVHFAIKALAIVKEFYPKAELVIAGKNLSFNGDFKSFIFGNSYHRYLYDLLLKYNLRNSVTFTGPLGEEKMAKEMAHCHVFVLPSSIENSPNSLAEAMLMGVPCVSSYVGGVSDMLSHEMEGYLYAYDEYYMLAYYICKIFSNDEIAIRFSEKAKLRALKTHDRNYTSNVKELYREIGETQEVQNVQIL